MGTMICLGVGKMEIDWGKNNYINDHSALFKTDDIHDVPYFYADDEAEDNDHHVITEYKEGLSRSLSSIKKRLDLLGYTLPAVEKMYNQLVRESALHSIDVSLSFNCFSRLLKEIDVNKINTPDFAYEFGEYGYDLGEFVRRCIIPEKEIYSRLLDAAEGDARRVSSDLECFFENMDPYVVLRLLAENPSSNNLDVFWAYADLVDAGWFTKEEIVKQLPAEKRIIVVTEGSSDSKILKKAIDKLYPEISDFFLFIDMTENYPFTGTGNLYNFCCGLSKIGVLNNTIIIFDNDCAGTEKFEKLKQVPKQSNLLVIKLPDCEEFERFDTVGPQGGSSENINGSAVSIECFLDFNSVDFPPVIRWTNYSSVSNKYQGSLQRKEDYTRKFMNTNILEGSYDVSKIKYLVDYIIEQWCNRE